MGPNIRCRPCDADLRRRPGRRCPGHPALRGHPWRLLSPPPAHPWLQRKSQSYALLSDSEEDGAGPALPPARREKKRDRKKHLRRQDTRPEGEDGAAAAVCLLSALAAGSGGGGWDTLGGLGSPLPLARRQEDCLPSGFSAQAARSDW